MTTTLSADTVHRTFGQWVNNAKQAGLYPMIFVVGTRGKSTVARLLDTIARDSGLRTALRTDSGVEIEGKRQLGDIHPLIDALEELDSGELDLAIIEMHWNDLQSLPLGTATRCGGGLDDLPAQGILPTGRDQARNCRTQGVVALDTAIDPDRRRYRRFCISVADRRPVREHGGDVG